MYDVFGLGNAIVDTEVKIDDSFLRDNGITKGHMTLVDSQRMQELNHKLETLEFIRSSGGSAANTIYAVQAFGHQTAYSCKVANDEVGQFFLKDMDAAGVHLNASAQTPDGHSGQCLVLISPDAERTMNTDLGVSSALSTDDVDFEKLRAARYFYVEGYLSSSQASCEATIACRDLAREAGVRTAISLSDPSMVEFFKDALTDMLGNGFDVVFCNEEEALSWAGTDRLDIAIAELKDIGPELYITLGAEGSLAIDGNGRHAAAGYAAKAVDTTGAGDIYAGAVLAARCGGAEPADAARFANFAASSLVSQYGARFDSMQYYQKLRQRFH